jgi:nucleoside-diphosphate-sugar epimerase
MNPSTVYGISKLAGERWCEYYFQKFGVDVRSIRYPGLIGYKAKPGGGTTDYAVDIYWKAVEGNDFTCFLKSDTALPMMYMDDAVRGTIALMQADSSKIKTRSSYNLSGMSFTPDEIFQAVRKHFPDFKMDYAPDFRQAIADSWPKSIDDSYARNEWGWNPEFDLDKMSEAMITGLKESMINQ